MSFGSRLKEAREKYGWSAPLLADKAGIPYETVYRAEQGIHQAPQLEVIKKLALALSVSIDYLAELTENPNPARHRRTHQTRHAKCRGGQDGPDAG